MAGSSSPSKRGSRADKNAAPEPTSTTPSSSSSNANPTSKAPVSKKGRSDTSLIWLSVFILAVAGFVGKNPGWTLDFFKSHGIDLERHLQSLLPERVAGGAKPATSRQDSSPTTPVPAFSLASNREIDTQKITAVPAAGPRMPGFHSGPSTAFYRPRVIGGAAKTNLTVSLGTPHGSDTLQLFLHRNGVWIEPQAYLIPRDPFCASTNIQLELSRFMPNDCQVHDGKHCRVFLHNGWEVSSCEEIHDNDHVWLVTPQREFIWPTFEVGTKVEVRHVKTMNHKPLIVETLATRPKVFLLENFFNEDEAQGLINNALGINEPSNRLKRSTTGQGSDAHEDSHRTSENAWDMTSRESIRLKKRIFELLGIRPYHDEWADGLQVLRYNKTQAYNSHLDYLDFKPGSRLDSAKPGGANRFATVVLYLSDVEDGGETVFPNFAPPGGEFISDHQGIELVHQRYDMEAIGFKKGSWQERLVGHCKTRLAVKPQKLRAVLFYDQLSDGRQDDDALHAGCPVISGTKWAANLWVWNGKVHDDNDFAEKGKKASGEDNGVSAEFISTVPGYSLYWKDVFFGEMHPNVPIRMNTFTGHVFNIRAGNEQDQGKVLKTFVMGPNTGRTQRYQFEGQTV